MAREYEATKYFKNPRFINPHYCNKLAIENLLLSSIFVKEDGTKDTTRVFYSPDNICFRKRLENVANEGYDENTQINITTLDLPFANYWQSSNWEGDDRPNALTAAQMLIGHYDHLTYNYLKAMAVKSIYTGTLWFSRDDEARIAYQILQWEQNPTGPTWQYTPLEWYGVHLLIPSNITFEKIEFNPEFDESKWLESSRIIPVTFEATVRTYTIQYEDNHSRELPFRFDGIHKDKPNLNYGEAILAESVQLDFLATKEFIAPSYKQNIDYKDLKEAERLAKIKPGLEGTHIPDSTTNLITDLLSSYFSSDNSVALNACKIVNATETSLQLQIKVKPADMEFFSHLTIQIPGHDIITIKDCKTEGYLIENLHNNSEYHLTIMVYAINGPIRTIKLTGKTLESITNEAPTLSATTPTTKRYPKLEGFEF